MNNYRYELKDNLLIKHQHTDALIIENELINSNAATKILDVSKKTLLELTYRGRIPSVFICSNRFYRKTKIENFKEVLRRIKGRQMIPPCCIMPESILSEAKAGEMLHMDRKVFRELRDLGILPCFYLDGTAFYNKIKIEELAQLFLPVFFELGHR